MGVITTHEKFSRDLGTQLSAKFCAVLEKEDTKWCSRMASSITVGCLARCERRCLQSIIQFSDCEIASCIGTDGFNNSCVLGSLDIGDAFLQVSQPMPQVVKLGSKEFIILCCLPGQRDASKLLYHHFVNKLQTKFKAEVCIEQPCVLKVGNLAAMVLHVDDVLFMGDEKWIRSTFLPELEKEFKVSSTVVSRETGGSFEFLKRCHVVDVGYNQLTVYPEVKHVSAMFERYSRANGKHPKLAKTPCTPGSK